MSQWQGRNGCRKLAHIARVVQPGKTFRCMSYWEGCAFWSDRLWWATFLDWNGRCKHAYESAIINPSLDRCFGPLWVCGNGPAYAGLVSTEMASQQSSLLTSLSCSWTKTAHVRTTPMSWAFGRGHINLTLIMHCLSSGVSL